MEGISAEEQSTRVGVTARLARHVKYERTAEKYDGAEEEKRVRGSKSYLLSYLRVLGRPLCRAAKMAKKISRGTREFAICETAIATSAAGSSCC